MKKKLIFIVLLLLALAACGGDVNSVVESAQNIAEDVADSVNDELSGTDTESTPEPTEEPAEEVVEEVVEEPAAGPSDRWAGSTLSTDMAAVGNAAVSINGVEGQSDANGNFELYVPRAEDGRYVINATLDGYLPVSQIHIGSAMEMLTLEFQPVETVTFDPTVGVEAEDSSGTQISIGANQLEDADGNEPTGDVTLSMYTYDLTQEEMVGDMSGVNDQGEDVAMESAGAFYASFEDEAGTELNLKDGETAEISIPATVEERPNEVLTVWSYDPETGLWVEEGVATLEDGRYVADVSHFSYWNFDWEKRTPSCIKLTVEPGYLAANTPLNVRAILQTNPVTVRDLSITQATNVLINLPNNTDVKFYRSPDYANPIDTVNSGAAWGGVGTPAHPYDACQGQVVIADAPEPVAATVQGQVTDAVSGNPIAGAQVCLQGTSQCVTTDADGNYTITDAPAGDQVLTVTADSYITVNDQAVTITAGETTTQPVALSPELAVGELRIVLTWGDKPSDLDSYLDLPSGNQISHSVKGQLIDGAILDLDDVDGHGPETITISQLNAGTYTYAIYNYGRGNLGEATTIPASGAVVRVYRGDQEIATYTAESLTGDGNTWNVFTLDGATGNITPVNTLSQ